MTGPSDQDPVPAPANPAPTGDASAAEPDAAPPRELGLFRFTIAGRAAPGLFVAGWLATLVGGGITLIVAGSASSLAGAMLTILGLLVLTTGLALLAGSQTIERRAAGVPYAGPSPVLLFVAVVATSRLMAYAVGVPLALLGVTVARPVGDLIAALLQAAVFLGVVRLLVVGPGVLDARGLGLSGRGGTVARELVTGALFAGPVILATGVVTYVAVQVAGVVPTSPLPPTGTGVGLALHLVAGAIVAPVAEEVLFRGAILGAWLRSAGPGPAIVRSSLLFVLAHVLFIDSGSFGEGLRLAFVGGLARVPVALTLGWLAVRSGRLWAPIGLHATFNAVLLVLAELAPAG